MAKFNIGQRIKVTDWGAVIEGFHPGINKQDIFVISHIDRIGGEDIVVVTAGMVIMTSGIRALKKRKSTPPTIPVATLKLEIEWLNKVKNNFYLGEDSMFNIPAQPSQPRRTNDFEIREEPIRRYGNIIQEDSTALQQRSVPAGRVNSGAFDQAVQWTNDQVLATFNANAFTESPEAVSEQQQERNMREEEEFFRRQEMREEAVRIQQDSEALDDDRDEIPF